MPLIELNSQGEDVFKSIDASNIYIFDSNNNSFYEGEIINSSDYVNPCNIQKTETIVSTIIGFTSDELKEAGYPVTGITIVEPEPEPGEPEPELPVHSNSCRCT